MSNVMEMKNLKNKVSRNGFDLSERRAFTAKVGEILPCFLMETIPGDHVSINPSHFTRTMPVNTAAYARLREYVHFYFVPYRLLHHDADVFFSDNNENPTRAASISHPSLVSDGTPYMTMNDVFDVVYFMAKNECKNSVGYSSAESTLKLLEYLGYGDFSAYNHVSGNPLPAEANMRLNPFSLLAYQKIYYDHFRNQNWEMVNPSAFNIDYLNFGSPLPFSELLAPDGLKFRLSNSMFAMRYCDFNKDYFFGLLPNAQYGDSVHVSVDVADPGASHGASQTTPVTFGTLPQALRDHLIGPSVVALRKAEALQKYREIKQSGNKDYRTFLEKMFNVSVSDDRSDICRYLGGYNSDVDINEVVNTALNDSSQATIQGKGIASGGSRNIDFDVREHGIIMGIYTCRPTVDYALDSPLRMHTRVSFDDYANPVFDRIGMETVHFDEVMSPATAVHKFKIEPSQVRKALGYAPRYYSYKTNFDKVHGEFRKTLRSWVTPLTSETIYSTSITDGAYAPPGVMNAPLLGFRNFKVRPDCVDSIFVAKASDTTDSDHLLVNMAIGCPVVRNLDYDGLPY